MQNDLLSCRYSSKVKLKSRQHEQKKIGIIEGSSLLKSQEERKKENTSQYTLYILGIMHHSFIRKLALYETEPVTQTPSHKS